MHKSYSHHSSFRIWKRQLGYLPQDFGFYPEFTVEDYLLYIAALKGIRPVVAKKRVKLIKSLDQNETFC